MILTKYNLLGIFRDLSSVFLNFQLIFITE